MSALRCHHLTVRYGDRPVLREVDLEVRPRETVAVLGPSGSGKTTLLYAVAGFVEPVSGRIELSGRTVAGDGRSVPPEERDVGVVFQHYALWPHLDALDTVAYPLRRRGIDAATARHRAGELLELVGIAELGDRRPAELSGGQQQRVGIARALARGANLYLFDEPTSHLDAPLRTGLQDEIARLRDEVGAAAVYATHDAQEALAVSDRVVLLRDGRIVQDGPPEEVYARPVDRWAAELTGPAAVIEIETIEHRDGVVRFRCGEAIAEVAVDGDGDTARLALLVRPEWARLGGPLSGVIRRTWYRGPHTDHVIETPVGELLVRVPGVTQPAVGDRVTWTLDRARALGPVGRTSVPGDGSPRVARTR